MASLFKDSVFLLVASNAYPVLKFQDIVTRNGGVAISKPANKTKDCIEKLKVTHVIASDYSFAGYSQALELMIPITSPQWLEDSELASQKRNYRLYSPVPLPFMDKVVLCIADNLPQGDRETMYAGVRAFGGQYLDALSRYTTHLVAADLSNNKSVIAANIKKKEGLEIRIVLPHWIDDCIRQQRHVDEKPYLLSDPVVIETGKPNFERSPQTTTESTSDCLMGKRVYLASDHNLSERLEATVKALITLCGGEIISSLDTTNIDVYVGKFRLGKEFLDCFRASDVDVGSLQWLYSVAMRNEYIAPLQSNLLHFPLPEGDIPELRNMRISVTGYSGDARHYLSVLITSMGAVFTKTLDCQNNYLVASKPRGEKYAAVTNRWPSVKIVNHLWVEECFAKWSYLNPELPRYTKVDDHTQILGKAKLRAQDLGRWIKDTKKALDIEDSMNEDEEDEEEEESAHADISDHQLVDHSEQPTSLTVSPAQDELEQIDAELAQPNEAVDMEEDNNDSDASSLQQLVVVESVVETKGRSSRSAKQKATMKLHSDMEDLNQYTSMAKSSRKEKIYMDELEKAMTTPNKKRDTADTPSSSQAPSPLVEPPQKKKKTKESDKKVKEPEHIVAIMTGCEQSLVLNRADVVKLSRVGITIVSDYSTKKTIDTIIAPRVLRTEKFLKSLSTAKQIVHPSYLAEVLSRLSSSAGATWEDLSKEYNIKDYFLDKVVPVAQINEELGVKGKASGLIQLLASNGSVFKGLKLNLSTSLNGGPALIASILEAHGLEESKVVKLAGTTSKMLINDGKVVIVAHKTKDKKTLPKLLEVEVVDWDWCVQCMFQLKLQPY